MKSAIDALKKNISNSGHAFSGITKEQIAEWEATTNIYIAKLMALGGYTRNDVMQNIIAKLKNSEIVFNELDPAHHAALHDYLEDLLTEEIRQVGTKIVGNPFVIIAVDAQVVTFCDMGLEANALSGSMPESVIGILRALT